MLAYESLTLLWQKTSSDLTNQPKLNPQVKEHGKHTFIGQVKVRLDETKYWAELVNFGHRYVQIPDFIVHNNTRLLEGGLWARVNFEYHEEDQVGAKFALSLSLSSNPYSSRPLTLMITKLDEEN